MLGMARNFFHQILTFTQANLQGAFVGKFLQDYALNRFIHLKENIHACIHQHQYLGAHTNIILFDSGLTVGKKEIGTGPAKPTVTQILWSHDGRRPLGNNCLLQCPTCHALKSWTPTRPKDGSEKVIHKCRNCARTETYNPIPGATEIRPPGPKRRGGDERGSWLTKKM